MTMQFLGADYGAASRVLNIRDRTQGQNVSLSPRPHVGPAQRFDIELHLEGDGTFKRKYWTHRAKYDIDGRFPIQVPQEKDIPLFDTNRLAFRVMAKQEAGDSVLGVRSSSGTTRIWNGLYVMLANSAGTVLSNRLHLVVSDDADIGSGASSDIELVPALAMDVPKNTRIDCYPTVIVHHGIVRGFTDETLGDEFGADAYEVIARFLSAI